MNPDCPKTSEVTKNTPYLTRLLRSWRFRIIALLPLILLGCVHPQKNAEFIKEPAPASAPKPKDSLSDQLDRDAVVEGICIMARELHDHLLRTDPDQLDKMGKDFWETLSNCADLEGTEQQKRGD